jgi:hypothetical protein
MQTSMAPSLLQHSAYSSADDMFTPALIHTGAAHPPQALGFDGTVRTSAPDPAQAQ